MVTAAVTVLILFAFIQFGILAGGWLLNIQLSESSEALSNAVRDPRFGHALLVSLGLGSLVVGIQILLAIAGVFLLERQPMRGLPILLVPALLSPVSVAVAGYLFLSPVFSPLLTIGTSADSILAEAFTRPLGMILVVATLDTWQWLPPLIGILVYLRSTLPQELYEQNDVEGARPFQVLRYTTLPALTPAIAAFAFFRTFEWLRVHDMIFVMFGQGGPGFAMESLSLYFYRLVFGAGNGTKVGVLAVVYFILFNVLWAACLRVQTLQRLWPWKQSVS